MSLSLSQLFGPMFTSLKLFSKFNKNGNLPKRLLKMSASESELLLSARSLIPQLHASKRKGQAGRIGVIGGSVEYTGAPYFSAISALKVGADLVHVFCAREASSVIKSYSPELIVHPLLDAEDAINKIEPWLDRLHVVVIGPGLGRDQAIFATVSSLIKKCQTMKKPLVIDADGLFLITQHPDLIKGYPGVILTPNAIEYSRLFGTDVEHEENTQESIKRVKEFGNDIVVIRKGKSDLIFDSISSVSCSESGSGRRCGGQGDLLSGSLGTFYAWALNARDEVNNKNRPEIIAGYAACRLTRECNARAFDIFGRSMTCTDMITQIHLAFHKLFESNHLSS